MSSTPFGIVPEIVMVGQLSVIVKPRVPKQPLGSDALTVKLYWPGGEIPVGVPLITPEALSDNPFGSEPDARLQLYTTPVVPAVVAVRVVEYGAYWVTIGMVL